MKSTALTRFKMKKQLVRVWKRIKSWALKVLDAMTNVEI